MEQLRVVARDLKNAMRLDRHEYHAQRVRDADGAPYTVGTPKLLSLAEYRAAEGNPAAPLAGEDPFLDKVAISGRSASLLNMDWMIRNAMSLNCTKHPPATCYLVNEVLTSVESGEARIKNHHGQLAREQWRKLKVEYSRVLKGRIIAF